MKFERVLRVPKHRHFASGEQALALQSDITELLNAHIEDYSDPHHNFTALTPNYLPKKSGGGVADSIISDDGTTASVAGHIDIADTKSIFMAGDAVIKYWQGNDAIAIGKDAGEDISRCVYLGFNAGDLNTGIYSNAFGYAALASNSGAYSNAFGGGALRSNTGAYSNAFGYAALYQNAGTYSNAFGYYALASNTGIYSNAFGYYALASNSGAYSNAFGGGALRSNTGISLNAFGYNALQYNDADYATALGSHSFNNFDEDVPNEKTFDNTDIDVANDRITIVGHGFGANNSCRNLKFTEGTSNVPGVTTGTIHQFKVISADIVEIITDTITGQGTGTGHKLTPQFIYTASTAIGYNAEPDAAYQIMLGSENVTWIKTHGSYRAEGGVLCLKEITTPSAITDYGKIYTKNDNKLYFQSGDGVEHEVVFV